MRRIALSVLVMIVSLGVCGGCRRSPGPSGPQVIGPLPRPSPALANDLPHEVLWVLGVDELSPTAGIQLEGLRGDRPRLEEGGTYAVWGNVTRPAGSAEALLMLWNADGESAVEEPRAVRAGPGTTSFAFRFRILRLGALHLSLYPPAGGHSLGGLYFHPTP